MGLGIAFPFERYTLHKANCERLTNTKSWADFYERKRVYDEAESALQERRHNEAIEAARSQGWRAHIQYWLGAYAIYLPYWMRFHAPQDRPHVHIHYKYDENAWIKARDKSNHLVSVDLKCNQSGQSFWVHTYHMPCEYKTPIVMNIHAGLLLQYIQNDFESSSASQKPYIIAGDFNCSPKTSTYQLLTTGTLPFSHREFPHSQFDEWTPVACISPVKSAYAEKQLHEPSFTTYRAYRDMSDTSKFHNFIETLDYIFLSPEWAVKDVVPLPDQHLMVQSLPNAEQPSDHILIGATLKYSSDHC